MKPILAPLYPFSFLFVTLLVTGESTTIYSPTDHINLNCGSSSDTVTDYDSRTWRGDINSNLSPIEVRSTSEALQASDSYTTYLAPPYATARLSHSEFTYRFPVNPGQKFIRLYFYPDSYNADFEHSESLFSVKAGGYTLLKDFNASVTGDAHGDSSEKMLKEFCINIEQEQQVLNITFTPSKDGYAFINGIEIMSMPASLYYTAAQGDGPSLIGTQNRYPVKNNTALENIYRINVGGYNDVGGYPLVSPNEDTGMYRTWDSSDEIYLLDYSSFGYYSNFGSTTSRFDLLLKFARIPNYTAPEEVYRTGRSMGDKAINLSHNLTWGFPVDPQFNYLVRLHFCEIVPNYTMDGDRVFQIFIDNQTAEQKADIIQWSGGNGIPVYRDYLVFVPSRPNKKKGKVDIIVALQANSKSRYKDAILNGLEIFKLNDTNGNLARPNPDPQPNVKPESSRKPKKKKWIILAGVASVLLVLSLVGFLVFRRGRKLKDSNSSHRMTRPAMTTGSHLPSYLCRYFSLTEMKATTKYFDDTFIIGAGGFGNVYKGFIDGGGTPVAIKRLKAMSSQGSREFRTEIEMLSRLRHRHLVSLIGFCADEGEMILVYDYMARGTLRDHLYHTDNPPLPWEQRLQICIGAAQGLHYLHTGTKGTIIHRDIKSTNILLDEKWVAKVSDFGLSRKGTITVSKTHISTKVKGSFGYLDPDYYRRQQLTEKSDVYSFGVVLCEVLCGRPAITTVENNRVGLAGWAEKCHRNGKLDQIIDPNLNGKIAARCLHKFVTMAMNCIDDNGVNRPSMDDVVRGLQFALQLQQNNEDYIDYVERTHEDKIVSIKDNEGSSEQDCGANESVQGLTGTIFSEIIDPIGR